MLVGFLNLPHGFGLLEGNIYNHNEPLNEELLMLRPKEMPHLDLSPFKH
jgi:hypothetical protein